MPYIWSSYKKTHMRFYVRIILFLMLFFISCKTDTNENIDLPDTTTPGISLTDLGNEQWRMGNYQEALKYFTEAYKQVKQNGDEEQMATLLNNLGLVHWRLEDNDAAMECYNEAAQLAEKLKLPRLLGLTYTNRALILKEKRKFDQAFEFNNKAIAISIELKEPRDLAIAYNNQGQIYRYNDQLDPALKYYKLSLDECLQNEYREGMATAYQNLSTVYALKGDKEQAFYNARKGLAISLKLNSKVRTSEAYYELSRNHERFNRPDSALYYLKKHYEWESEILESNQKEILSRYQAGMGVKVKNLRIENLQHERAIAANRLWFIGIGIFIVLLFVAFFIYRYLYKLKFKRQQLEKDLYNTQKIIEVKEVELKTYILDLSKKNSIINRLQDENSKEVIREEATEEEVARLLEQKILTDEDWEKFKVRFNSIYPDFFSRIKDSKINLTEAEIRIMVLMRLELNGKDMANILGISPQSVRVCKMRLKKKLPKECYESVEEFLQYLIN
ncbi:tetratricopeptide repeat protein [Flavobacterium alkalisoli]|uniref:Tetratricopeptide repeat protein n=2 Tax=Flavobacterium alkalisoli TaxID=2602769 RepID=A0A5B9FS44_9FLAO|nr:tetratricopeptide repeat protein [Flavobacterium alkalisoli]